MNVERRAKHVMFQIYEQLKGTICLDETKSQPIKEVLAIGTSFMKLFVGFIKIND